MLHITVKYYLRYDSCVSTDRCSSVNNLQLSTNALLHTLLNYTYDLLQHLIRELFKKMLHTPPFNM